MTALMSLGLIGITGVGVDLGRMYIAKNEAQAFADAAALTAAQYLDGTSTGLSNARTNAGLVTDRWNLNTKRVTSYTVDFSLYSSTNNFTWVANPNPATNYSVARVRASVAVPLTFMRVLWPSGSSPVSATAIGAQAPKTSWKQGVFPFSPFAHLFDIKNNNCDNSGSLGSRDCTSGLVVGQQYTLRWPANPTAGSGKSGNNSNMCPGDQVSGQTIIDVANAAGGSERGFIEDTSASLIAQTIIDDFQSVTRTVGDLVTMTGGAKQSQGDSLDTRIQQDLDTTSTSSTQYFAPGNPHNNRRVVACLINDGNLVNGNQYRAIEMGAFLLLPTAQYGTGGNQSWCAEYLGPYVQGAKGRGAGGTGGYVVRLVQ
jgi:hypothetical protein